MFMMPNMQQEEEKQLAHRGLYNVWTDRWQTWTCSKPAHRGTTGRKTRRKGSTTPHTFKEKSKKPAGRCLIPTDLCPFTLDTLTTEPLVLIRCGTQSWVRWKTDLQRWTKGTSFRSCQTLAMYQRTVQLSWEEQPCADSRPVYVCLSQLMSVQPSKTGPDLSVLFLCSIHHCEMFRYRKYLWARSMFHVHCCVYFLLCSILKLICKIWFVFWSFAVRVNIFKMSKRLNIPILFGGIWTLVLIFLISKVTFTPRCIITKSLACEAETHLTLMFITLSYWARSAVSMPPMARIPALLTRTSSRPKWATVRSTVFFTVSSSVRSPGTSSGCTFATCAVWDRGDTIATAHCWKQDLFFGFAPISVSLGVSA